MAQEALFRLDTDRSLRKALLARARNVPDSMQLQPGDLAYFWRVTRAKKGKLLLKRWHGPAVVLGREGLSGIYLGYQGTCTKCAPESVRAVTPAEMLAFQDWDDALREVLDPSLRPEAARNNNPEDAEDAAIDPDDQQPLRHVFGPAGLEMSTDQTSALLRNARVFSN